MPHNCVILVLDDSAEISELLGFLFSENGFEVRIATDPQEAMWLLRGGLKVGLILLDLMADGKGGRIFRQQQMAESEFSAIPVIVYSNEPGSQQAAIDLGAVAHAEKTVHFDDLLGLVIKHCRPVASKR